MHTLFIGLRLLPAKFMTIFAYEQLPEAERLIVPRPTYDDAAALWVYEHISAELPIDPRLPEHRDKYGDIYDRSVEFQEDLKLFLNISKFQNLQHINMSTSTFQRCVIELMSKC